MTSETTPIPPSPDPPPRQSAANTLRVGAVILLILATATPVMIWTIVRNDPSPYLIRAVMFGSMLGLITPILLLALSGRVARGFGGSIAACMVLACHTALSKATLALFSLTYEHVVPLGWRILPAVAMSVVATWVAVAMVRLWIHERSLWPDPARVTAARSAWFRARILMTVGWSLILLLAGTCIVVGVLMFIDDPRGMAGGFGVMFAFIGAIIGAGGIWLLILWWRLRRKGPIVARSTAWQVAAIMILWVLMNSVDAGSAGLVGLLPSAFGLWLLIELVHASLARMHGAQIVGGFDVIALADEIPIATAVAPTPPPLPPVRGS